MARDRVPVLKRCRSLNLDPIFLGIDKKSKKQNQKAGKKMSEYGLQLREKQKSKFIYGVLEKQFRGYYAKAEQISKKEGIPGENLLMILELRLDNVMFRLGYGRTRKESRQIVRHKHVLVNGKPVDIPSYQVKPGDTIGVRESSLNHPVINECLGNTTNRVSYVTFDDKKKEGTYVRFPEREELNAEINESLIVEFYNR